MADGKVVFHRVYNDDGVTIEDGYEAIFLSDAEMEELIAWWATAKEER